MGSTRLTRRLSFPKIKENIVLGMDPIVSFIASDDVSVVSADEIDFSTAVNGPLSTHKPIHTDDENKSKPNVVEICDACIYCNDNCQHPYCVSCQGKATSTNNMSPCFDNNLASKEARYYTICQVRRHNHIDSAWLIVGDTIYDASPFIKSHPGGIESILKRSGGVRDCTRDYEFHSVHGKQLFKRYMVGKIKSCPGCTLPSGRFVKSKEKPKWFLW